MSEEYDRNAGNEDSRFERHARDVFMASVEGLDAGARSRLNRSRQRALELADAGGREQGVRRWKMNWMMPAGALAASVLVAALMLRGLGGSPVTAGLQANQPPTPAAQDPIELLAVNADDLQLATAEDDLDFYAWIDDSTDDSNPGEGQT